MILSFFFFLAEIIGILLYSIVRIYHILFTCPLAYGFLGLLSFLVIMKNVATMNKYLICLYFSWVDIQEWNYQVS